MKNKFSDAWSQMVEKLDSWFNALVINLPNILIAIVVFLIALMASKYISRGVSKLLDKTKLQASMKSLLSRITSFVVVL